MRFLAETETKVTAEAIEPPEIRVVCRRIPRVGDVWSCHIDGRKKAVLITHDEKMYAFMADWTENAEKEGASVDFWRSAIAENKIQIVRLLVGYPVECN